MHIISMHSNAADNTLSGSGRIRRRISGHIRVRLDFKNFNPVRSYNQKREKKQNKHTKKHLTQSFVRLTYNQQGSAV